MISLTPEEKRLFASLLDMEATMDEEQIFIPSLYNECQALCSNDFESAFEGLVDKDLVYVSSNGLRCYSFIATGVLRND